MATQPEAAPTQSNFNELIPTDSGSATDDNQLIPQINDFLQKYSPAESEINTDTLKNRYRIEVGSPLPNLDTKTAKAYNAVDLTNPDIKLFALVCAQGTLQRHDTIKRLKGVKHENMLTLYDAGVVKLSVPDQEQFVVFYSQPNGKKLSELLSNLENRLHEEFISKSIIAPIISAIGKMADIKVSHGSINTENIFYGEYPVLGDCVTEPCGASQPFFYEPIDRMQAMHVAKGEGNISKDYYAMAILAIHLLYGKNHFDGYDAKSLSQNILHNGAYIALIRGKEPPESFNDFLRGLLSGNVNERWNFRNLKQWIEGKRSNIMLPIAPAEASQNFEFCGVEVNTRRELAHLFFLNWDKIKDLLQEDKLTHWVLIGLRDRDLSETIKHIQDIIIQTSAKNEIQVTEQLMRLIMLFDNNGPIRINTLSFNLDGINSLWLELLNNNSQDELKLLAKFIEHTMSAYWLEMQRQQTDYVVPESINNISLKLNRIRPFIRNKTYGFGAERVLYDLNPEMPCQSPIFTGDYIDSLPKLLAKLDSLAPELKEQDPLDLHTAAFIANRLGVVHEIKLHELIPNPSLATNRTIMALQLIANAQAKCGNTQFPGLTHWLALRIMPALETIRSTSLRSRVKSVLLDRARSGYTQLLAELIVSSNYAIVDTSGYVRAQRTYQQNIKNIKYYTNEVAIDVESDKLGLIIAKFFAYLAMLIVIAHVWINT